LSGNAGRGSGTIFQLSFNDSSISNSLLTSDPTGINSGVSIDATGLPTPMVLDVSATVTPLAPVPEPASLSLPALGGAALVSHCRKRTA
jgi:hypothetical protein